MQGHAVSWQAFTTQPARSRSAALSRQPGAERSSRHPRQEGSSPQAASAPQHSVSTHATQYSPFKLPGSSLGVNTSVQASAPPAPELVELVVEVLEELVEPPPPLLEASSEQAAKQSANTARVSGRGV
jgi:hypothetical protein